MPVALAQPVQDGVSHLAQRVAQIDEAEIGTRGQGIELGETDGEARPQSAPVA